MATSKKTYKTKYSSSLSALLRRVARLDGACGRSCTCRCTKCGSKNTKSSGGKGKK